MTTITSKYNSKELEDIFSGLENNLFGPTSDPGVYFVIRVQIIGNKVIDEVVYVGSSKSIAKRVLNPNHIYRRLFSSTQDVVTRDYATTDYIELEKAFIAHFKPRYNKQHVPNGI